MEKIVDGKKQTKKSISYTFERAKLIPVYDITTKTPNKFPNKSDI